jgi:hypothetical protein
VKRRQAVHELDVRVAGQRHRLHVDLVGRQQLDPLRPHVVGLAHRDPHIGQKDVAAPDGLLDVVGDRYARAARRRDLARALDEIGRRPQ